MDDTSNNSNKNMFAPMLVNCRSFKTHVCLVVCLFVCLLFCLFVYDLPVKEYRQNPTRGYKRQADNSRSLPYKH